jgi:hypothetical protein
VASHEDRGLVALLEQLGGEVEPTDAEVRDADVLGKGAGGEPPHDLDAEAVVSEEDVAETRHQDLRGHDQPPAPVETVEACNGSNSSG